MKQTFYLFLSNCIRPPLSCVLPLKQNISLPSLWVVELRLILRRMRQIRPDNVDPWAFDFVIYVVISPDGAILFMESGRPGILFLNAAVITFFFKKNDNGFSGVQTINAICRREASMNAFSVAASALAARDKADRAQLRNVRPLSDSAAPAWSEAHGRYVMPGEEPPLMAVADEAPLIALAEVEDAPVRHGRESIITTSFSEDEPELLLD